MWCLSFGSVLKSNPREKRSFICNALWQKDRNSVNVQILMDLIGYIFNTGAIKLTELVSALYFLRWSEKIFPLYLSFFMESNQQLSWLYFKHINMIKTLSNITKMYQNVKQNMTATLLPCWTCTLLLLLLFKFCLYFMYRSQSTGRGSWLLLLITVSSVISIWNEQCFCVTFFTHVNTFACC